MKCGVLLAAVILNVFLPAQGRAQTVHVRVINWKSGKALPDQRIDITLHHSRGVLPVDDPQDEHLTTTTNDKGDAHFELNSPPSEWISVYAHIDQKHWLSENQLSFRTKELLNSGVTTVLSGPKAKASTTAKSAPRELVFMVEPMTFRLRLIFLFGED